MKNIIVSNNVFIWLKMSAYITISDNKIHIFTNCKNEIYEIRCLRIREFEIILKLVHDGLINIKYASESEIFIYTKSNLATDFAFDDIIDFNLFKNFLINNIDINRIIYE